MEAPLPTDAEIWDALQRVTDPEYPLSIVDLGMVYGVRVVGDDVHVEMTFTSAGCPAIDMLDAKLSEETEPAASWSRDRISERGRKVLALYGVVS